MFWKIYAFLSSAVFFFAISIFSKYYFWITIRVSTSLDPDQARQFVGPDLDPNCLQRLSADDMGRQRVKEYATRLSINGYKRRMAL